MNKIKLIIFYLYFCILSINAQDFNTDMQKVKETYSQLQHFECTYDIGVYFNDQLHSSINMEVKFSDSNYIYNVGKEITAICNTENLITLDHDLKFIAIGERKSFEVDLNNYLPQIEDSINYKIESKIEVNGMHTYTLTYNKGLILNTTISLNPKTGHIIYLEYTNRENEEYAWRTYAKRKTIIKFKNLNKIERLPASYFSLNNYVIKTKNEYKPIQKYSNYQIIDTTAKPKKK